MVTFGPNLLIDLRVDDKMNSVTEYQESGKCGRDVLYECENDFCGTNIKF